MRFLWPFFSDTGGRKAIPEGKLVVFKQRVDGALNREHLNMSPALVKIYYT